MRRCRHRGREIKNHVGVAFGNTGGNVPTPTSDTSLTLMRAWWLAFFRSWISSARSSIE
jgi:hypothetical protein